MISSVIHRLEKLKINGTYESKYLLVTKVDSVLAQFWLLKPSEAEAELVDSIGTVLKMIGKYYDGCKKNDVSFIKVINQKIYDHLLSLQSESEHQERMPYSPPRKFTL